MASQANATGPSGHSTAEAADLLVLANRILANEGVLDAFGHVSVRCPERPDRFLQSRSLSPEFVTVEDILEFDLDGNTVQSSDLAVYSERVIHAAILRARPEVQAVFHGHPRQILPFACTGIPIRPVIHSACMFAEGIPLYDDYDADSGMLISSAEEARRLSQVLGGAKALLMRGHGCVVVGESVPAMVMGAIYLRDNAAVLLKALALGEPRYLSPEEGQAASRVFADKLSTDRAWNYWVGRARKAMPDPAVVQPAG